MSTGLDRRMLGLIQGLRAPPGAMELRRAGQPGLLPWCQVLDCSNVKPRRSPAVWRKARGLMKIVVRVMGQAMVFDEGPDHLSEKVLVRPLMLARLEVCVRQVPHIGQNARDPAPQSGQDQLGMKDRVAHDMKGLLRDEPLVHRDFFLNVQPRIAIPAHEPIDVRVIGDVEPPE